MRRKLACILGALLIPFVSLATSTATLFGMIWLTLAHPTFLILLVLFGSTTVVWFGISLFWFATVASDPVGTIYRWYGDYLTALKGRGKLPTSSS